jgi:hypothetical protein
VTSVDPDREFVWSVTGITITGPPLKIPAGSKERDYKEQENGLGIVRNTEEISVIEVQKRATDT